MVASLPTEVLIAICEQARSAPVSPPARPVRGKRAVGSQLDVFKPCVLELRSFSCASRRFREVAAPMLFRNVCIRTREQVVALVRSRLLVHVCHVHFPAINILTCRRPLGSHIATLVQQAQSLKIASSELGFYTDLGRHLGGLLGPVNKLCALEIYGEANLPHIDGMAVLADFVPTIPKTVNTLSVSLPGGRPSFAGIETFFARISPEDSDEEHLLPNLRNMYMSMQLPLQIALSPAELALPLARRLPSLDLIAIAAPKRGPQSGSLWDLGGPGGHAAGWGMSGGQVKIWKVRRYPQNAAEQAESRDWEQTTSIAQVGDFMDI